MSAYVYVPVTLKGLVMGAPLESDGEYAEAYEGGRFADIADDYSRIEFSPLGEYVPAQLTGQDDLPCGVHLHWSLPDALTHGYAEDAHSLPRYPLVPDRWLLTRMWKPVSDVGHAAPLLQSWVVAGNALHTTRSAQNGNLGSASVPVPGNFAEPPYRYLGASVPLSKWAGHAFPELTQLTAVTQENLASGAFYPTSRNVFGFYDDMHGENGEPLADCDVAYCVAGWYAQDKYDPLNVPLSGTASGLREDLNWRLSSGDAFDAHSLTVCHGMLFNIEWRGPDHCYGSGVPKDPPDIAVGNNSSEALAALIARKARLPADSPVKERMIAHMLAGLPKELEGKDGVARSEAALHENRFSGYTSAKRYTAKPVKNANGKDATPGADFLKLLEQTNAALMETHRLQGEIARGQEDAFALWLRFEKLPAGEGAFREECLSRLGAVADTILAAQGRIKDLQAEALSKKLEEARKIEGCSLSTETGERFWEPTNPVILLAGIERGFSHGEDGRFSEDGSLLVRRKTVSKIKIIAEAKLLPKDAEISGAEILGDLGAYKAFPFAPPLLRECALLCPAFSRRAARLLAGKANGSVSEGKIAELGEIFRLLMEYGVLHPAVWGAETIKRISEAVGADAAFPEKTAVEYWKQPWYPMYIDWTADFYPDGKVAQKQPDIGGWRLGDLYDFAYTGELPRNSAAVSVTGRSFITPHAALNLAEKVKELGLEPGIRDAAAISVLSQAMGGFHDMLTAYELTALLPRYRQTDSATQIMLKTGQEELYKVMESIMAGYTPATPVFDSAFLPVRAGWLKLREISVIDSFGQLQRLSHIDAIVAESMRVSAKSGGKEPPNGLAELPPRIVEPAQLCFEWLSGDGGPVHGFLLPNFVDRNLLVFSGRGEELGSLQCVRQAGAESFVWKTRISCGGGTGNPRTDIKDPQLLGFVLGLLDDVQKPGGASRLALLLGAIDSALWGINPGAAALDALFGKPLALARAEISLRFMRPPRRYAAFDIRAGNTAYPAVATDELAGVLARIGIPERHNDGVLGFFLNDAYNRMRWSSPNPGIGKTDAYFSNEAVLPLTPSYDRHNPQKVTMLLDPTAEVNIRSGLLPVKTLRLDPETVEKGLASLYHLMFAAPALLRGEELRLPLPVLENRRWVWSGFNRDGNFVPEKNIGAANARMVFGMGLTRAAEGWVRYTDSKAKGDGHE